MGILAKPFNPSGSAGSLAVSGQQDVLYSKSAALNYSPAQWQKAKLSPQADQLQNRLQSVVDKSKRFLAAHSKGQAAERALQGLDLFEKNRIRCHKQDRDYTTYSLNLNNLETFSRLLDNTSISLEDRVRSAENLFSSLGVCSEGEASNIQDCTVELNSKLLGTRGKFQQVKTQLAKQQLLTLVRHVVAPSEFATSMEVHHVNTLVNVTADQLGLPIKEDAYQSESFARAYGNSASRLVQTCLTDDLLVEQITSEVVEGLHSTMGLKPGQSTQFDPAAAQALTQYLSSQMGSKVSLHDVIEIDAETGEVSAKTHTQLQQWVLSLGKQSGVISQAFELPKAGAQPALTAVEFIQTIQWKPAPVHWAMQIRLVPAEASDREKKQEDALLPLKIKPEWEKNLAAND
ncbi:MAG: hypothetical protein R3194_13020 [Limnobacter sp.]|nr:hypothetical protein [Limnobacter sp.]